MNLADLKTKISEDADLAAKFKGVKDLDEIIKLANEAGLTIRKEDLQEVSDEDLDKAAGGINILLIDY